MNPLRAIRLRHLNLVAWALVALGVLALAFGMATDDGEIWQLVGLMLVLAGGVKVFIILVWTRLAGLETDRHQPIPPV